MLSPMDYIRKFSTGNTSEKGNLTKNEINRYLHRFEDPHYRRNYYMKLKRNSTILHIGAATAEFLLPLVLNGHIRQLYIYDPHETPSNLVMQYPVIFTRRLDIIPRVDSIYISQICHYMTDKEIAQLAKVLPRYLKLGGSIYIRDHDLEHSPVTITKLNMKQANMLMDSYELIIWINTLHADSKEYKERYKTLYLRRMSKLVQDLNLEKVYPSTYETKHSLKCLTVQCVPNYKADT